MEIDKFLEIENKYKLNELVLDGVNYWTYNRFNIWNYDICSESLSLQEPHNKTNIKIKDYIPMIKAYLHGMKKCKKHQMLVLNHHRRVLNEGKYECIYTDRVLGEEYDTFFLEAPFQYKHLKPTLTKRIHYTDKIVIDSQIKVKLFKTFSKQKYQKYCEDIEKNISDAVFELNEYYGWTKSSGQVAKKLADTVLRVRYEKKKYKRLLEQIQPSIIVEVVHYGRMQMIINELAKDIGIQTIELQHGTMYKDHAAYQYSKNETILQLPDKLFTFSEFWNNCISFPIGSDNIVVTGFPHFENKMKAFKEYQRNDKRKTILFISQGTIGKYLSDLAVDVSSQLPVEEYRIIYKLHPSEYSSWKNDLPRLLNTNIEVIDTRDIDLYELFAQSDIQVGAYSTAIFEGMGFGLRTYIYSVGHYDIMLPLIEQGYAGLVNTAKDCIDSILEKDTLNVDGSMFWKSDAQNNILNEINKIIR